MMHVEWYGVFNVLVVEICVFMFILICALFIVLGFVLMYVVWFVLFHLSGIYIYIYIYNKMESQSIDSSSEIRSPGFVEAKTKSTFIFI